MNRGTLHLHLQLYFPPLDHLPSGEFTFVFIYPTQGWHAAFTEPNQRVVLYLPEPDDEDIPLELYTVTVVEVHQLRIMATGFTIVGDRPFNKTIIILSNLRRVQLIAKITEFDPTVGVKTLEGGQNYLIEWYQNEIDLMIGD